MADERRSTGFAIALVAILGVAGTTHFVNPRFYDVIVPRAMPGSARGWTYVSGVAELICAVLVARRGTRRVGAWLAFVLFIAVFPANVQMAVDWMDRPPAEKALAIGRLPFQIPLLLLARRVAKDAPAA